MNSTELEQYAAHYLPRLGDDDDAFFALIDADHAILPILTRAFRAERDAKIRERILEVIWQHRVPSALPILTEALQDSSELVWKQALDGLMTIDSPECLLVLERARDRKFPTEAMAADFQAYVDEAIDQLRHGVFGEKDRESSPGA
jgi:hypothetical protein